MHKVITFLGLSFTLIILIFISIHFLFKFTPNYPIDSLDNGWTVIYRNEKYINTNLERMSDQVGTTFSRGDTVTLTQAKPLTFEEVPFPYLLLKTQYSAFSVFLDNELIAKKNLDTAAEYGFIGIGYNAISLPKDYYGKKLTIKLYISENNTRVDLVTPLVGNFDDLYRYLLHSELFPFFVGIFLIIFGLISLIISLMFYIKSSGAVTQIICSLISIALEAWMISAYSFLDFFLKSSVITTIEFIAMYSLVPLLYILVYSLHPRYNNTVIAFLGYSSIFFSIIFLALHFLNRVHINHFQYPYYLMSVIGFVMLVFYVYLDIRNHLRNASAQILMVGTCVLAVSLLVYISVAVSNSLVDYRQNSLLNVIIPWGSLFFVITQLLNHFIYMTRTFAQRKEYASLSQIAYIDNLTGVNNRVSCDNKLSELDKTTSDFCILSLDLNGLKEVNDNAGHPAGDRLLKSFADSLLSVFGRAGSCFRIGGDEFLVIFNSIEKENLNDMLVVLDQKLKILDEEDSEINHSVSYGYAFRSETEDKDTHSVVMLADKRMYDYKRKFYSHMMRT